MPITNNSPSFSSDAGLSPINEDAPNPAGATVLSLMGGYFVDADASGTAAGQFAGIAIAADASTADQGAWQYSFDGASWTAIGSVSGSGALLLSSATHLRFLPAANYNGQPGVLSVHAVDGSLASSFSSAQARIVFDTTIDDGTSAVSADAVSVAIEIVSQNDAPTVSGNLSGGGNEGDPAYTLNLLAGASDIDHPSQTLSVSNFTYEVDGVAVQSRPSGLTLVLTGGTLTVDPSHNAFNSLSAGVTSIIKVHYFVTDGSASVAQTAIIMITGTNDAPLIGGAVSASVTEDAGTPNLSTGGALTIVDADQNESSFVAQTNAVGAYGLFSVASTGAWTYAADNGQPAIQQLGAGQSLTETLTVVSTDGTASKQITVTINGTNDVPVIGGADSASVTEDASTPDLSTGGILTIFDADQNQSSFVAQTNAAGTYGVFSVASNGEWTYVAGNGQAAIQQLGTGQSLTDTLTVVSADGTASKQITVTINGANEALVIGGAVSASVTEDAGTPDLSTGGALTIFDTDQNSSSFAAQTNAAGAYGLFSVASTGEWTYVAGNGQAAIQQLGTGQSLTETFTVVSADGTASQVVTVTINGTNDAPVAHDDMVPDPNATLTFEQDTFTQNCNAIVSGGYSFSSVSADSVYVQSDWGVDHSLALGSYSSGNNPVAVSMTKVDGTAFSLASANITALQDGNYIHSETITGYRNGVPVVTHTFDVPNINNNGNFNNVVALTGFDNVDMVVFSLTEAGGNDFYQWIDNIVASATLVVPYTEDQTIDIAVLGNDTDVDHGAILAVDHFSATSAQGASITQNGDGTLHYDPTQAVNLQALAEGQSVTDTFTYAVKDEHGAVSNEATVSVLLHGVNDAPVVAGALTNQAGEGDAAYALDLLAGASDVDHGETATLSISNIFYAIDGGAASVAPPAGVSLAGHTLTVDPSDAVFDSLAVGEQKTITVSYNVTDVHGASVAQTGTITITGTNDAPVLDLNGPESCGNDFSTIFRPRGAEVALLADGVSIADVDGDTIMSATVSLASGAKDNLFGTTYETLHSTAGSSFAIGEGSAIVFYGNGSGDHGLTGATVLTLSGAASHADYANALQTIVYNNSNPNAFSGDRTVTMTVTDDLGLGSNAATVTVHVPWTPVVDMNGGSLADGRNHQVSYVEGDVPVAIARPDASITDQGGLIKSITATLINPLDGSHEALTVNDTVVAWLTARGIAVEHNGTFAVTFTAAANADASDFQIGLRGLQYANDSQHPDPTQRVVTVTTLDADGNTGVSADTLINVSAVNDAPLGFDSVVTTTEDQPYTFGIHDFGFTDPVDGGQSNLLAVHVSTLPASGTLLLNGVALTAGQAVSLDDIGHGLLTYAPEQDHNGAPGASFTFQVQDDGGTDNHGVDLSVLPVTMAINIAPVNDAPVLHGGAQAPAIAEDVSLDANTGTTVAALIADGNITDVDLSGAATKAIAVTAVDNSHGMWEYKLVCGGWTAFDFEHQEPGTALLLGPNDSIRFVPDANWNGTLPDGVTFHPWDQTVGSAGNYLDVAVNAGGIGTLSAEPASIALTVTPVNDVPTLTIVGPAVFHPRGGEVHLFDAATLALADVDGVDAGEVMTSVTLVMDAAATLDNAFGITYETLASTQGGVYAGDYLGSMGHIAFTGNGTAAQPLTLTGAGTVADYTAALLTLVYNNTNPNAYAGVRPVAVTVHYDDINGNAATLKTATLDVAVNWAPVADLNGESVAGVDWTVSYAENNPGLAIAASDASLVDQQGNIKSGTVTLDNSPDGAQEKLYITQAQIDALRSIGIEVSGNNSHAIILTGDKDGTVFQLGLRSILYTNASNNPDLAQRTVTVSSVDMADNPGVKATTYINPVRVNDAATGDVAIANDTDAARGVAAAQQNDVLHVSHTLADPDGLGAVTYQWLRDGQAVSGATGDTYALGQADVGKVITVIATYTDGGNTVEHVSSGATNPVVNVNDAPVAVADVAAGTENASLTIDVLANDTDADDGHVFTLKSASAPSGAGTASVVNGKVVFNPGADFDHLAKDAIAHVTLNYDMQDEFGAKSSSTVEVTITGTNDAPVISSGAQAGAVQEDSLLMATGTVASSDVDNGATASYSGSLVGNYGSFVVNAGSGVWTYTLDNANHQNLAQGESRSETFTVTVTDDKGATATQDVLMTITGTNDAPVVTNASTAQAGAVLEAGNLVNGVAIATGALTATDVDAGATHAWSIQGTPSVTYGAIAIDAATGVWTYTLNNALAATQALKDGAVVTQTYTARVTDEFGAFVDQTVTVTINGTNDAAVITGDLVVKLVETNAILMTGGQLLVLTATDVDSSPAFVVQTNAAGNRGYGNFSINAAGAWTYNANTAHNEFVAGLIYTDTLTVATADGTTQVITVNITGAEDAPTIKGDPTEGQVLTATNHMEAPDGHTVALTYQWFADGVAINGATGDSFKVTGAELANAITVQTTYAGADGNVTTESAATMAYVVNASVPDAGKAVVLTIDVSATGATTTTPVSLSLNGGADVINLAHQVLNGETIVIPSGMVAPLGAFAISGAGNTTGSEHFSLYVDSDLAVNGYWVQNAAGTLVNLASAPFGGSMVTENGKTRLDFTIADNSEFDTNHADHGIATTGLAAQMGLSIIGHVSDVPTAGVFF